MRLVVSFIHAFFLAFLLSEFAMATAQANPGPARHDCCKGPSQMSHHAERATQAAGRAILTLA